MLKKIRRAARLVKFYGRDALRAMRNNWSQESYEIARSWKRSGDVYEVTTPDFAEFLGEKWPGRPFVLYPEWHYDRFDHVFDTVAVGWYVLSGRAAEDACRDADEDLLANAY